MSKSNLVPVSLIANPLDNTGNFLADRTGIRGNEPVRLGAFYSEADFAEPTKYPIRAKTRKPT